MGGGSAQLPFLSQSSLIVNLLPKAALDPPYLFSDCREIGCKSAVLRVCMHLTGLLPCRAVRREFRGGVPRPLVGSDRGQVDPRLFTSSVPGHFFYCSRVIYSILL